MRFDEFIYKRPDLIETQFGGSVRIEHSGVIDMFAFESKCRFDNQRLDVDVGLLECS